MSDDEMRDSTIALLADSFERRLAALRADTREDWILAWDYPLGVAMIKGEPVAVSVEKADSFEATTAARVQHRISNGMGVSPVLRRRKAAIAQSIDTCERALARIRQFQADFIGT